jgi:hypothetical protein
MRYSNSALNLGFAVARLRSKKPTSNIEPEWQIEISSTACANPATDL